MIDGLAEEIAILAADGTILAVNEPWRRYAAENAGDSQNLSVGANYLTVCDAARGEGRDDAQQMASAIRAVAAGETDLFTLEYPWQSDSEQRWFLARVTPFLGPGPARVIVSHQNVTARKALDNERVRLLEFTRLLLESTAEGIFGLDTQGRCTFINRAAARLLGYKSENVIGRDMQELIHQGQIDGPDLPIAAFPMRKAFQSGVRFHSEAEILWRSDGTSFPASYSSFPMIHEGGIIGAVVTFSDISERKRIEHEKELYLLDAQDRADRDPLTSLYNHRAFYTRLDEEAEYARQDNTNLAIVMLDLDNFKFFNDAYGHATGDDVLRLVATRLQSICRRKDILARFGGDEFALLLPNVRELTAEEVETRLRTDLQGLQYRVGQSDNAVPIVISLGAALLTHGSRDTDGVLNQADNRLRWSKTSGHTGESAHRVRDEATRRIEGFAMLDALVTAVNNKDRYTRHHSEDVMHYSLLIAEDMGFEGSDLQTIAISALLHDVGKIGVADAILRKPGRLTDEDFEAVKQHTTMGAIIVQAVPGLEATLNAVRHHHERWDGRGYPSGLRGDETPLSTRLMAVADAFSAITLDRPYRSGIDRPEAMKIMEAGAGTQWDPECVAALRRVLTRESSVLPADAAQDALH